MLVGCLVLHGLELALQGRNRLGGVLLLAIDFFLEVSKPDVGFLDLILDVLNVLHRLVIRLQVTFLTFALCLDLCHQLLHRALMLLNQLFELNRFLVDFGLHFFQQGRAFLQALVFDTVKCGCCWWSIGGHNRMYSGCNNKSINNCFFVFLNYILYNNTRTHNYSACAKEYVFVIMSVRVDFHFSKSTFSGAIFLSVQSY